MRESLREERTLWVTDQIAQDKFPEDLEGFYLLKNPPAEEKPVAEEEGGGGGKKGKVGGVRWMREARSRLLCWRAGLFVPAGAALLSNLCVRVLA